MTTWTSSTNYPALEPVMFPSGDTATLTNASNICMICHQGRESTVQVNDDIAACSGVGDCDADCTPTDGAGGAGGAGGASGCDGLGFVNIHYYAAAATFFGTDVKGGYEYDTQTYVGQNSSRPTRTTRCNDCIDCHMEANPAGAATSSCRRLPAASQGLATRRATAFPTLDVRRSDNYDAIQTLLPVLLTAIEDLRHDDLSEPIVYDEDSYPYWFNVSDGERYQFDATLLRAAYNYQTGPKGSRRVHPQRRLHPADPVRLDQRSRRYDARDSTVSHASQTLPFGGAWQSEEGPSPRVEAPLSFGGHKRVRNSDLGHVSLEGVPRMPIIKPMLSLRRGSWLSGLVLIALLFAACKGDTGEPGPQGPPGEPGPPGETPGPGIEPELFGLVGRVIEPNLLPVPGGTVYLVPASDVAALAETPIDLFLSPDDTAALTIDEPIEDLLDTSGDGYEQVEVDASGVYRFETLPEEGRHFVVWTPAEDDAQHLPGGDSSSVSFDTASLIGMQLDIRVSSQPGPSATYVGSSTCMVCHGLHSTTRTAHNVGLQVPGVRSTLQDVEPWPDFDDGLAQFEAGTDLYYFDCTPLTMNPSKCSVDESSAGAASFQINLREDSGAYYIEMVKDAASVRYDVVLTYGGALGKQQYLMRRTNGAGSFSYFVLPLQYNYRGDFNNESPEDWPWRDYRSDLWYDFAGNALTDRNAPANFPGLNNDPAFNQESFDNNCAGCHFTGYRLEGSDADGWAAGAIVDSDGAFDYDGDGRVELINTGCESCHGPGSEHLELSPRGSYIVSPGSLTPGRQAALCGSCHSRPLGIGGGETGLPLSEDNEMPPPGIRRRRVCASVHHARQWCARGLLRVC